MNPLKLLYFYTKASSSRAMSSNFFSLTIVLALVSTPLLGKTNDLDHTKINKRLKTLNKLKKSSQSGKKKLNRKERRQHLKDVLSNVLFSDEAEMEEKAQSSFGLTTSNLELNQFEMVEPAGSESNKVSETYRFKYDQMEICKQEIKAQELNGELYVMGRTDSFEEALPVYMEWPNQQEILSALNEDMSNWGHETQPNSIHQVRKCWYLKDQELIPTIEVEVLSTQNKLYSYFVSSEGITAKEKRYFHVSGSINAYVKDREDGATKDFSFSNFSGDGTLTTDHLTTSPFNQTRANEPSHQFDYSESDPKFLEAGSLAYTQNMLTYFEGLGYSYGSSEPKLVIKVNDNNGAGGASSALYTAKGQQEGQDPIIAVGQGSIDGLQDLGYDPGVFSHELGHHIIFTSGLKDASNFATVVLHEGLADYFVFNKTNDPCLARSVCPADGGDCFYTQGDKICLRSAENEFGLDDSPVAPFRHLQGMTISGFLWDLSKEPHNIPKEDVAALAYGAVQELAAGSGYRDFFLGLLIADKKLFASANTQKIYQEAIERKFGSYITDLPCSEMDGCDPSQLPEIEGASNNSATDNNGSGTSEDIPNKTTKKSGSCGVVHLDAQSTPQPFLLMFLLFLTPLALVLAHTRDKDSQSSP